MPPPSTELPLLPGQMSSDPIKLPISMGLTAGRYGEFSLASFIARYMAGNGSLREARLISRKRLALVASGIGFLDNAAYFLNQQIASYLSAKATFMKADHYDQALILQLNRIVSQETRNSGKLRQQQNWVGGDSLATARYVCPPPERVPLLFNNWLEFLNDKQYSAPVKAIIGHCQLASIHPFYDGNGRTARLIMDAIFEQEYGDRIPLLAYRLSPSCPRSAYTKVQVLFNQGDPSGLTHPFWSVAMTWGNKVQIKISTLLAQTQSTIFAKIGLYQLSAAAQKLVSYLWRQPIVCEAGLRGTLDRDPLIVRNAISELVKLGLLVPRQLRTPQNAVIFECPCVFAAYTAMDEAIFSVDI